MKQGQRNMDKQSRLNWAVMGVGLLASFGGGCNEHIAEPQTAEGLLEFRQDVALAGSEQVDILWVIDNSGSMCEEQRLLRENFDQFISQITETNIDFHISVTTTHVPEQTEMGSNPAAATEPVARAGEIQSTPQPIPGSLPECRSVEAVYRSLEDVLPCMSDAARQGTPWAADDVQEMWSENQVACALTRPRFRRDGSTLEELKENWSQVCKDLPEAEIQQAMDILTGRGAEFFSEATLFPDPQDQAQYRPIPKVLRFQDYFVNGVVNRAQLQADFACMSFVGTRGYGIEKGLLAATLATSPEKLGAAVLETGEPAIAEADTTAPNFRMVRKNARFAVVFVTDENDCSFDVDTTFVDFATAIGFSGDANQLANCNFDNLCEWGNSTTVEGTSPLFSPEDVKAQLLANLAAAKGAEVSDNEVIVASIHGRPRRFEAPLPSSCDTQEQIVDETCDSDLGTAKSGDRYDRFLKLFPYSFPGPANAPPESEAPWELMSEDPSLGRRAWICESGGFTPALQAIGQLIGSVDRACITRNVFPCTDDTDCPAQPFTGEAGQCLEVPNSVEITGEAVNYCNSGLQLIVNPIEQASQLRNVQELASAEVGYCLPESIGTPEVGNGCVITPSRYTWQACGEGVQGLALSWNDPDAVTLLGGYELTVRYTASLGEASELPMPNIDGMQPDPMMTPADPDSMQ